MYQQKRMFKVLAPIEKANGGGQWWMRCGNGFLNKDNSINLYIDAIPMHLAKDGGLKLQVREFTEEELRERAEKRSTYSARGTLGSSLGDTSIFSSTQLGGSSPAAEENPPF